MIQRRGSSFCNRSGDTKLMLNLNQEASHIPGLPTSARPNLQLASSSVIIGNWVLDLVAGR